jgi:hypothetical protein
MQEKSPLLELCGSVIIISVYVINLLWKETTGHILPIYMLASIRHGIYMTIFQENIIIIVPIAKLSFHTTLLLEVSTLYR